MGAGGHTGGLVMAWASLLQKGNGSPVPTPLRHLQGILRPAERALQGARNGVSLILSSHWCDKVAADGGWSLYVGTSACSTGSESYTAVLLVPLVLAARWAAQLLPKARLAPGESCLRPQRPVFKPGVTSWTGSGCRLKSRPPLWGKATEVNWVDVFPGKPHTGAHA